MSKKEKLLEQLRTSEHDRCELTIQNEDMIDREVITFYDSDFRYKANYIDLTYHHDLTHKYSSNIKIVDWVFKSE